MASSFLNVSSLRFFYLFLALILLLDQKFFTVVIADDDNAFSDSQSDVCSTDMTSFLPPPYGNSSKMICKPVWNTFVLRFFQSEDHVVTIVLSAVYTAGWVGIGFSKNGMMVGSSAMVGWVGKEGRAAIKQYYLEGSTASGVKVGKGELPFTNVPPVVVIYAATIYMAFQLEFAARLTHQPIILAFSSANPSPIHHRLVKHDDKTTISIDFDAGSFSVAPKNTDSMKRSHGTLGVIGWGLLLPSGAIVARYFKHSDPLWYYLHTSIQFLGFLIGLAAVVAGTALYDRLHVNIPAHRGIGIFVLVLSILQIMAFFLRPDKDSKIRRYWNWYHHGFGRLALFFGAVNIVLGIQIGGGGNSWKVGYGFLLAIVLVTVIVLEVLLWLRRPPQKTVDSPSFQMNPTP